MAATLDAVTTATNAGTGGIPSFSWSHPITVGATRIDIVVAGGRTSVSPGTNGVKRIFVGGQAATRILTDPGTGDIVVGLEVYRLLNPPPGAVTILAERDAAAYAPVACTAISFLGANPTSPGADPVRVIASSPGASPFTVTRTIDLGTGGLAMSAIVCAPVTFTAAATASGAQTELSSQQDADARRSLVGLRSGDPPNVDHRYDLDADTGGRSYITATWTVQAALPVAWIGARWLGPRWVGRRWYGGQETDTNLVVTGLEATAEMGSPVPTPILRPVGLEATGELGGLSSFAGEASWMGERWFGRTWFGYRWFGPPAPPTDGPVNLIVTGLEATAEIATLEPVSSFTPVGIEATAEQDAVVRGIDYDITPDGEEATGELGSLTGDPTLTPAGLEAVGELGAPVPANVGNTHSPGGLEAIAEQGTLALQSEKEPPGLQAESELGTLALTITHDLIGLEAVAEMGVPISQVDEVQTIAVTGIEATGELGFLTDNRDLVVTGIEALGELGGLTPAWTFTPFGVEALGELGLLAVDSGGVTTLPIPDGLEAEGELGILVPITTLRVTGIEAVGEVGMDRITVYGIVRMVNVGLGATELTGVTLGHSTLTNVEVIW